MRSCHLHLGSNQGDRKVNLGRALQMIDVSIGRIISSSALYETAAWGVTDQDDFINMAIEVECYLKPRDILKEINVIELELGRIRDERWGPRLIDIDIILIGDIVVNDSRLTIPHRLMHERNFVLYPMVEIAADAVHPILNMTMRALLDSCTDDTSVNRIENF